MDKTEICEFLTAEISINHFSGAGRSHIFSNNKKIYEENIIPILIKSRNMSDNMEEK